MGIHCATCKCPPPMSVGHRPCPRCDYPTAASWLDDHPSHICEQCTIQLRREEDAKKVTKIRKDIA